MSTRTFGSDPEMMITKDGCYYSAIGIVQGDIERRISLRGHEFYYDNVLAECAIKPGRSKSEVVANFKECFQLYADMVRPFRLTTQAAHDYPREQLAHPDAVAVGCACDTDAYELKQHKGPTKEIATGTLRSCGGHVHLGADVLMTDGPEHWLSVYMLDLFLGVPSLWLDHDPTSAKRRRLYGQAGRYRTKEEYGLEYRPLGNFWISSPRLVEFVYDMCQFVIDFVEDGRAWDLWSFDWDVFFSTTELSEAWTCNAYDIESLRNGINNSDRSLVLDHFELAKKLMPDNLREEVAKLADRKDEGDLYSNWKLT